MARSSAHLKRLAALAFVTLALAAGYQSFGGAVSDAQAATACGRFGDERARNLKVRQARAAVRCLVNRRRTSRGLSRLGRDTRLQRAAQKHTEVMRRKRCFAHQCPGEPSLTSRLRSIAYLLSNLLGWAAGENIAWGSRRYSTPRNTVKRWMNSPGHRANILHRNFREVGVGFVRAAPVPNTPHAGTYTTDFGMRRR